MRVALRGILANRMRSALTMLGILIGTAAVILLVAVGTGISNQVQVQIKNLGTNAIYILPERNTSAQNRGTSARRIRLTKADVKALSDKTRAPSIDLVAPTVGSSGTVTWQGNTYALQNFIGGSPEFGDIRNTPVAEGRFLNEEDIASHAKVAVIGQTVVDHLFGKGIDPVGQQVEFNGVRFRIVGLQVKKGSNGFQDQDDFMFAPISTVIDNIVGNVDSYTIIGARAANKDMLPEAMVEIRTILSQTHALKPGDPPDFIVFNAAALLAAGKAAAKQFQLLLGFVAAISLLIGGIGVMNIMLVTVTERTREIGIRKALGAQRTDIVTQFLSEAMLLASLGGLIGVAVGVGVGHLKSATMQPVVSPGSVVLSFGVSVLIGIFFGAYPASRAAALTPMEALRYE
ncbi:MAG: putative transport system permease protein [Actinomycetota bacterium]|jgi:putative ABC transport system permease protein|nr:putative transport system permease protein [Actinomycetota bacterium]